MPSPNYWQPRLEVMSNVTRCPRRGRRRRRKGGGGMKKKIQKLEEFGTCCPEGCTTGCGTSLPCVRFFPPFPQTSSRLLLRRRATGGNYDFHPNTNMDRLKSGKGTQGAFLPLLWSREMGCAVVYSIWRRRAKKKKTLVPLGTQQNPGQKDIMSPKTWSHPSYNSHQPVCHSKSKHTNTNK